MKNNSIHIGDMNAMDYWKRDAARGIIKDDYTLPSVKAYNKAVKEDRIAGSPIVENENNN